MQPVSDPCIGWLYLACVRHEGAPKLPAWQCFNKLQDAGKNNVLVVDFEWTDCKLACAAGNFGKFCALR